jgi:hypothetical protein
MDTMEHSAPLGRRRHKTLEIIVFLGFIAVIAIVVIVFYLTAHLLQGSSQHNAVVVSVPSPFLSPAPLLKTQASESSPSADLSTWKTYTQQYFTVKYPSDWYVFKQTALEKSDAVEYIISNKNQEYGLSTQPEDNHAVQIIINVRPDQYDKLFTALKPLAPNQKVNINNLTYTKISDTQISGVSGVRYSEEKIYKNTIAVSEISLIYKKNYYHIQFVSGSEEGLSLYKNTFEKILSTFTLTPLSPTPVVQTTQQKKVMGVSTPKTYKSTDGGFEFTYPSTWNVVSYNSLYPLVPSPYKGTTILENKPVTKPMFTSNGRVEAEIKIVTLNQLCGVECEKFTENSFLDLKNGLWKTGIQASGITIDKVYESTLFNKRAMVQISHPTKATALETPSQLTTTYYVYLNKSVLIIDFTYDKNSAQKDAAIEEFYNILSSFKLNK